MTPHASFCAQRHPLLQFLRCVNSPATSRGETHYKQFYENGVSAHRQQPNPSMYNPSCSPLFERIFVNSSEPAYKMQNAIFYLSTFPAQKAVFKKHPPIQRILHKWRQAHSTWQPHLRISAIHSRLTTRTQQPHCHSTCRAAATTQFPCLLRQEQCTAEEFSTGGTTHQVHQGLAQTLPHTL